MRRYVFGLLVAAMAIAVAAPAYAQGGGASSTGTIQGRVADAQGAVLPGVTVTATSPSALGAQTTVTSETGNYRFPAIPPGTYTVTYELAGFNTVKREGIQIALGFTATVNVDLQLATLQETVTVTGESPVIDTTATRVVQTFKIEQLQSLPNARDMWSLLAVTPAVQMSRIDVGGNRAGTQTGYRAYGLDGQVRVLIEGINSTEGTTGAGFYFDYSSLEEVFLGTSGQSAEMPNPGVQSQFIAKSGGNQFNGEFYLDWYNNSLQGANIPDSYITPTAFNNSPIREHSNEIDRYYNASINVGGPIKRDKVWWFGTYNKQFNAIGQPNFEFDKTFDTTLWNALGKGTYQATRTISSSATTNGVRKFSRLAYRVAPAAPRIPISVRARPIARTPAAGSTRASGTARSATSCMSKRATAISAITSRRSPTAQTRTSSAIMAGSKSSGRT